MGDWVEQDGVVLGGSSGVTSSYARKGVPMTHTTVIIPSLHSPWIGAVLDALHAQDYDLNRTEVLVVGLDKYRLIREDGLVRFISTGTPKPPSIARNLGLSQAQGDLICFLDSDCIPSPDWLSRLTAPYADPNIHVVGGTITFPEGDFWTLCDTISHFNNVVWGTPGGMQRHLPTLNFSARFSVFVHVGGFDESFPYPAGEDTELTKRMRQKGYHLWLTDNAVIHHLARRANLFDLWQRAYRHGQAVGVDSLRKLMQEESILFQWPLLLLTALPRALLVTFSIFRQQPHLRKYWYTAPVIFSAKLVWVLSAALAIYQQTKGKP
jgi:glycosyltransferase involved in cell wall biosynthesis